MPSGYPGSIDTHPTNNQDSTPSPSIHPTLHNDANDAINKIQRELGPNPSGAYNDVATRLQARPVSVPVVGEIGASLNAAIQAVQTAGGGRVEMAKGIGTIETPVILRSGVYVVGEGEDATILRAKNGTTHDVIKTLDFDSLVGTDTNAGEHNFGLERLTIDGNASARPAGAGRGVAIYGKAYKLMHFIIRNTPGEGMFSEWYSGGDEMEAQIAHFKIWRSRGHGLHYKGPHDSVIMDGQCIAAGYGGAANIYGSWMDSGKAAGTQCFGLHTWGLEHARAWYVTTAGTQMIGCQGEGASEAQLFLDAQDVVIMGGNFFGTGAADTSSAMIIGDEASGGYPARCIIQTKLTECARTLDFKREGGRNVFKILAKPKTEGDPIITGTNHPSDLIELTVDSETYTAQNTHIGSGPIQHSLPYEDNAAVLDRYLEGGDPDRLIEIDTQADPTIKFTNMWYEAVDGADNPAWEISPEGAAIFTKAHPVAITDGGLSFKEVAADLAPDTQDVILFARDNGSGKTRLLAKFATGAVVQLAIQP
jgi:hypothetical protein